MTNPTPHGQVPEALRLADELEIPIEGYPEATELERNAAAELRRLHAYCQELEAQVILDCMTHVQNPAEIEHVAGDVSKNGAESNMSTQPATQQEAQEPVAWYVTGCSRLLDEDDAKAEARHIGGTARAMPLYTAPQPSPTPQADSVLEDAALLKEARDALWQPANVALCERIDAYLDAARKQGGAA